MTTPVLDHTHSVRIDDAVDASPRASLEVAAEAVLAFNQIYEEAQGDPSRIPWAHGRPSPTLLDWLDSVGPCVIRPGARAVVVGCGLGDDVALLAERGYEVTGFDAAPEAIESARHRHPDLARAFAVADLFNLPGRLKGRFDLVIEIHTLQALPPRCRCDLAGCIVSLLNHHGVLFVASRVRSEAVPLTSLTEPPYPLTPDEMQTLARNEDLVVDEDAGGFLVYEDGNTPPVRRMRGAFRRRS